MWLFFEMILKSVAQFLKEVGKLDKLVSLYTLCANLIVPIIQTELSSVG